MVFIGPLKVGGAGCQVAPASPDPLIHPAGFQGEKRPVEHQVNPRVAYGNLSHVPNALRSLIGKGRRESKRLMVTQQQRKIPPVFGRSWFGGISFKNGGGGMKFLDQNVHFLVNLGKWWFFMEKTEETNICHTQFWRTGAVLRCVRWNPEYPSERLVGLSECLRIGFWLKNPVKKRKKNEFPKKMDMFSKDEVEHGERIHKRLPSNKILIIHSS